jgi:hypothetical protein
MQYEKVNWTRDAGAQGGNAALTNMEDHISTLAKLSAVTRLFEMATTTISAAELDFTGQPAGTNMALGYFTAGVGASYAPGASDDLCFDPRSCAVYEVLYYNITTGEPQLLSNLVGFRSTNATLTFDHTGRRVQELQDLDFEDDGAGGIFLHAPGHGIPLNTYGLAAYTSPGGSEEEDGFEGDQTNLTIGLVTDPDVLQITNRNAAGWINTMSNGRPSMHLFIRRAIMLNAGGSDFGGAGTLGLKITWMWDSSHPDFYLSLGSDD